MMKECNHFVALPSSICVGCGVDVATLAINGNVECEMAVSATPTPPPPPTFKEVVERVLEELANLPKEHQQKLYRFLYDRGCRI